MFLCDEKISRQGWKKSFLSLEKSLLWVFTVQCFAFPAFRKLPCLLFFTCALASQSFGCCLNSRNKRGWLKTLFKGAERQPFPILQSPWYDMVAISNLQSISIHLQSQWEPQNIHQQVIFGLLEMQSGSQQKQIKCFGSWSLLFSLIGTHVPFNGLYLYLSLICICICLCLNICICVCTGRVVRHHSAAAGTWWDLVPTCTFCKLVSVSAARLECLKSRPSYRHHRPREMHLDWLCLISSSLYHCKYPDRDADGGRWGGGGGGREEGPVAKEGHLFLLKDQVWPTCTSSLLSTSSVSYDLYILQWWTA